MQQLVVLNLGNGDWSHGCPTVVAQLWQSGQTVPLQWTGALPPQPELGQQLQAWRQQYDALYAHLDWRKGTPPTRSFDIDEDDVTNLSPAEFNDLCRAVRTHLNAWLHTAAFRSLDQALRTHLVPTDEIRLIVTAQNHDILRLPWHLWQLFDDYPYAEPAISLPTYRRAIKTPIAHPQIRILVVLGNAAGLDVSRDRALLEQFPNAAVTVLVEPDRATLNRHLWDAEWDLWFFAGHSSSQFTASASQGCLQLNPTDHLTLEDLRYGLRRAIAHGLKLAIFNSCDGLGLAWELADLHIPQVIVMREPVPDRVAQTFLQHFLSAFASGQSLYRAVRVAREQLQGLEPDYPCATWLPVIYQNPAEAPTTWNGWRADSVPPATVPSPPARADDPLKPQTNRLPRVTAAALVKGVLTSLVVSGLVLGGRSLGVLEPIELWGFDRLLSWRPAAGVDQRFLVVTLDEADIQAQPQAERVGSLSDPTLAQVLDRLAAHQPRVIGLDIYRDRATAPQATNVLQALQQNDRLIAVCKSRDAVLDPVGIAPPPEIPEARIGFSDFIEDRDGILRRQLISLDPDPASLCTTPYSFSARLAFRYLQDEGIIPRFTPDGDLQLGETVLRRVRSRWGGYQGIDAAGNQLMLNYRAGATASTIADQVSLNQLLAGQVAPEAIRDRIVILGVTANSAGDYWFTPFGSSRPDRVAGVFVQTHMTSQLLNAVLAQRPVIWVWPLWGEALWLVGWGLVGYGVLVCPTLLHRSLALAIALGTLSGSCFVLLLGGGWIPLIPAAFTCVLTATLAGMTPLTTPSPP
jgi:CHASE2 domain-containing sensor protein